MDVAQLGFEIDSSPAADAAQNLDKMADSATRAETGTAKARASIERVVQEIRALTEVSRGGAAGMDRMVDAQLRTIEAIDRMAAQMGTLSTASRTSARASEEAASGAATAERAINSMGETADQQAARIHEMVKASIAAKEAAGGIEESQRMLAERASMTTEEIRAMNEALEAAASSPEAIQRRVDALAESEARAARATEAATGARRDQGAELEALLGKIDPVVRKLGELDAMEDELRKARKAGLIGGEDFDVYLAKIGEAREAVSSAGESMQAFSLHTAAAKQQLGLMAGQIARGDIPGLQRSMFTLANRTGLLTGSMAGLVTGIGAAVGVTALLASAAVEAYREEQEFHRIVVATGGAAGVTAGQLSDMAGRIGAGTGRYREASAALAALAATGRLTGEQLEIAARGAVALATVTGEPAAKAAAEFEKLAGKPTEAVVQLNEKLRFLTADVYEQIAALERSGNTAEATKVAMRALADTSESRAALIVDHAGSIERAWEGVRNAVREAWQQMKDIGRTDIEARLKSARKELEGYESFQESYRRGRDGGGGMDAATYAAGRLFGSYDRSTEAAAAALERIKALEAEKQALDNAAAAQGEYQTAQAERIRQLNEQFKDTAGINARKKALRELEQQEAALAKLYTMQGDNTLLDQYAESLRKIAAEGAAALKLGADLGLVQQGVRERIAEATAAWERQRAEVVANTDVLGKYLADVADQKAMVGMTARQRAVHAEVKRVTDEYLKQEAVAKKAGLEMANSLREVQDAARGGAGELFDMNAAAAGLEAILSQFGELSFGERLSADIETVGKALRDALDLGPPTEKAQADIEKMQRSLGRMHAELKQHNLALISQGVSSLQRFAKEGTAAYTALGVAQDVLAYQSAVAAVANQGSGDPYTAFARIAAMIALMASIGIRVGGGGGAGAPSIAEQRQSVQGTGTVLGDASAKSESIAKAVEITANATEQLVGINRGMLNALQSLQKALGAAGGMLARGAGNVKFPEVGGGGLFLGLFGSSKTVVDQGIIIAGGALQGMLDQIVVGAYQTIKDNGGLFGGTSYYDNTSDISGTFGKQFQLVIQSIVDTVREGATALGLLPADIEAAIAAYRIEEIRISLKDLSAEEQQKELEAVFSSIFDGLAGAVVPFIAQFQQVGEGLGETLIRIATEVQVTQEAFRQLGLAVDVTDPERFAQIADGLIEVAGGIDAFIAGFQSFVANFASEEQQFRVAQDALNSAFAQSNLVLPETRDGMWDLMQSLDATTEAGREQIATLLRLADTADQYYSLLEKAQADMIRKIEDAYDTLADFGTGVGKGGNDLRAIAQSAIDAIAAANLLAKATGKQGAAEWELALIHRVAATRAAEAIAVLIGATQELVAQFYGHDLAGAADSTASAVRGFGSAMSEAAQQASDAIRLLLGDLSPLNDQAKLQVALQALSRGEVGREDVLAIGRRLYASSQAYNDLFARVMAMRVPGTGGAAIADAAAAQVTPEQRARERMDLAMQIGQNVATIADAQGAAYADVADLVGVKLEDIAGALGLSNTELQTWLDNLVAQQNRTPDSIRDGADRIIAAMYDIAGKVPTIYHDGALPGVPTGYHPRPGADGYYPDITDADDAPYAGATRPPPVHGPRWPQQPKIEQTEVAETTRELRDLMRDLLAAVERGDGVTVEAVREVAAATRDVSNTLRDEGNRDELFVGRRARGAHA